MLLQSKATLRTPNSTSCGPCNVPVNSKPVHPPPLPAQAAGHLTIFFLSCQFRRSNAPPIGAPRRVKSRPPPSSHVKVTVQNFFPCVKSCTQMYIFCNKQLANVWMNNQQFLSEEFSCFLKMNGAKCVRVAPYHAASNGLAERMVQSFKNHMKVCKGSKLSIHQRIENFLQTNRSAKHPTTRRILASLFLGLEFQTRLSLVRPKMGDTVMDSQAKQQATQDVHAKFRDFYPGDRVLVKDLKKVDTW